jgi:hypothetical protein
LSLHIVDPVRYALRTDKDMHTNACNIGFKANDISL